MIEMKSRGEIFGFEKGSKGWDFTVHYSDKPDRHIEVKGTVDTNGFVLLSDFNTNFKDAKEMPSDWCLWIIVVSKEKRVAIGEIKLTNDRVKEKIQERIKKDREKHQESRTPYRTWEIDWVKDEMRLLTQGEG